MSGDATCAALLMLVAPPLPGAPELVEVGVLSDEVREVEDVVVLAPLGVALALRLVEEELDVLVAVVEELLELDKELDEEPDEELEELLVLVLMVVEDDEDETKPIPNLGE